MTVLSAEKPSRLPLVLFALAVLVAGYLRFNNLANWPMWLDEAYSVFGAEKSLGFIWKVLPTYETHPPFYTTLLHGWIALFGSATHMVRLFGALVGFGLLIAVWKAARALADLAGRPRSGLVLGAVALAAVVQPFVDIARLVRPYSLIMLVYALGIWCVFVTARGYRDRGELPRACWLGYLLCQLLLFWLHNLGALYVAALGLALLILAGPVSLFRTHWRCMVLSHGVVALAALPAFLILLDQAPTWVTATWLRFNPSLLPLQLFILFGLPGAFGTTVGLLLALNGLRWLGKDRARIGGALLVLIFVPIVVAMLLSMTVAPVFLVRTLVGVCVPMVLLIAAGAADGLLPRAALIMVAALSLQRDIRLQNSPPEDDWYATAQWLAARVKPGDVIYAYANEGALPLHYALRDIGKPMPIRQLPSDIPARDPVGWYPTGSRGVQSLPEARLRQFAQDPQSRAAGTIWLVRIQRGMYDKGDVALRSFAEGRKQTDHYSKATVDITGLAR